MNPLLNASHRKLFGISLLAVAALAACGGSDDEPERTPASLQLEKIGGYSAGQFLKSAAEIPAFDAASKRAFVVNAQSGKLDVLDLSDPKNPKKVGEVNGAAVLANGEVNSVAVKNGLVAIAIQAKPKTDAGRIAIYQAADLKLLGSAPVGALPDMLTFTPDGKTILVANEAEPSDDYQVDPEGSISMVDVGSKNITRRVAIVRGAVEMNAHTLGLLKEHALPKGDVLVTAQVAGIMAAKRTSELIPLCHPVPLSFVDVRFEIQDEPPAVLIESEARTSDRTGVEMEAIIAAQVAAATIYDMCKAVDKDMVISEIYLIEKSGGKSGHYRRGEDNE